MRNTIFFGHPDRPGQDYVDRLRQVVDRTNRYLLLLILSIGLVYTGVLLPSVSDINKYKNKHAELSGRESAAMTDWRARLCDLKSRGFNLEFVGDPDICSFEFPATSKLQAAIGTSDATATTPLKMIIDEIEKFNKEKGDENKSLADLGRTQESLSLFGQSFSLPIALVPTLLSGLAFTTVILIYYARNVVVEGALNFLNVFRSLDKFPKRRDWLGRSPFWLQPIGRSCKRERYALLSAIGATKRAQRTISSALTVAFFCLVSIVILSSMQVQVTLAGGGPSQWLDNIMDLPSSVRYVLIYTHPLLLLGVFCVAGDIFAGPLFRRTAHPSEVRRDVLRGVGGLGVLIAASSVTFLIDLKPEFDKYRGGGRASSSNSRVLRAQTRPGRTGAIKYVPGSGLPGRFRRLVVENGVYLWKEVEVGTNELKDVNVRYRTRVAEALALERMKDGNKGQALELLREGISLAVDDRRLVHLAARIISNASAEESVHDLKYFIASVGRELPSAMVNAAEDTERRLAQGQDPRRRQGSWTIPYIDRREYEYKIAG